MDPTSATNVKLNKSPECTLGNLILFLIFIFVYSDPAQSETNAQPNAGGEAPPALNVMPPQMNVLHYPMGPRGPPVSLQPPPFGMPPQVPMHLHSSVPVLQVPVTAAQGLPPPPPPPPPMQQGSMTAIQADSRTTQVRRGVFCILFQNIIFWTQSICLSIFTSLVLCPHELPC